MQKNYFILFRDTYGGKTDMQGNKNQIQNCNYLCKGGRKCDGGELHRRPQLLFETFLFIKLISGCTNVRILLPILLGMSVMFYNVLKRKIPCKLKGHVV